MACVAAHANGWNGVGGKCIKRAHAPMAHQGRARLHTAVGVRSLKLVDFLGLPTRGGVLVGRPSESARRWDGSSFGSETRQGFAEETRFSA